MTHIKTFINPTVKIHSEPSLTSSLLTEGLFGEGFEIIKKQRVWIFGRNIVDNYPGWVKSSDLGIFFQPTHRVSSICTFIYLKKDIKSAFMRLSIGSLVSVVNSDENWHKINLPAEINVTHGYILKNDLVSLDVKVNDWVKVSEKFLDVPYFWGGRSSIGVDCSALVQLSLQTYGVEFPRDTKDQIKMNFSKVKKIEDVLRGDLLFWDGHVAIAINNQNLIHSNAFFLKTTIENISETILRLKGEAGDLKAILRLQV